MWHIRADDTTVSEPSILEIPGEYYLPVNKPMDCADISSSNSASWFESNAPPEPMPHYPSNM